MNEKRNPDELRAEAARLDDEERRRRAEAAAIGRNAVRRSVRDSKIERRWLATTGVLELDHVPARLLWVRLRYERFDSCRQPLK